VRVGVEIGFVFAILRNTFLFLPRSPLTPNPPQYWRVDQKGRRKRAFRSARSACAFDAACARKIALALSPDANNFPIFHK